MATTRRKNDVYQEPWYLDFDHAELTGTATFKRYTVPAGKTLRIDRIRYVNPTGLVGHGTDAFKCEVKNGATVIATAFNTDTGDVGGASLAADTPAWLTLSATSADCVLDATEELTVVFTEDGTATLPPGTFRFEGRLV